MTSRIDTEYVFLLAMDPADWDAAPEEQRQAWRADHGRFEDFVRKHGSVRGGEALDNASSATTVRRAADHVVTDGPFTELVEQLGGFYVVALPSLDTAIEAAKLLPDRYAVEIRRTVEV